MKKKPARKMSNASRLWVSFGNLWPPFCNQMVIEGSGSIDFDALGAAVEKASAANPGSRLVLRGFLSRSRWIDSGLVPGVRRADGSGWSGLGPEGAPFLDGKFDIRSGPTCEVLVIEGSPLRLAFRTHHAVMDGIGTVTWVEDIFRALRGEKPVGSEYCAIEDDFLNVSKATEKPLGRRYITPAGKTQPGAGSGFVWRRKKFTGRHSMLLPGIMLAAATEAWRTGDGAVRIGVPVNLRTRRPGFRSTSNLTNAFFIDVEPGDTPESISERLNRRLELRDDGSLTWEDRILRHIPRRVLEKALKDEISSSKKSGLYRYPAVISNLGRIEPAPFTTQEFRPLSVFFIPPGNEWSPFFMTVTGFKSSLEIALTMPVSHGGGGSIDGIMERITRGLNE
ncbi:MAG TPA: hypothetical protein P5346_01255 [Spirochaetota bacterium]|nr:hypothetical protein [Spirochaetota bacterium]